MPPILSMVLALAQAAAVQTPRVGLEITSSTTFTPGEYRLVATSDDVPLIRVVGKHDVTLDFTGVKLVGTDDPARPDEFKGTVIEVVDSRNVTITNLSARGYRVAIVARNSPGLHVVGCNFSYNCRPKLKSTPQEEDESDWMYYHDNEHGEWLTKYAAAMYLDNCDNAKIERNIVRNGQNGLMLVNCDDSLVWNNDFSFNSGLGVAMYRSSKNLIMHNKLDWCVRGYSHGVYNRGQDSSGILIYEQSNTNTFAYNSATHGGDGFFLWAGKTTMDTGQGGCNDNVVAHNDFSVAVANGIETTFSRNMFFDNLMEDCDYGIWGGYSYDSTFANNRIRRSNRAAIAIEHGQDNRIIGNTIDGPGVGIKLWMNAKQDPNWGYPKHRDTKSRDYVIARNKFGDDLNPILLLRDTSHVMADNVERDHIRFEGDGPHEFVNKTSVGPSTQPSITKLPDGIETNLPTDHPRGRQYMIVDDYGPYDFKRPIAVPREMTARNVRLFELLGPKGKWMLIESKNVRELGTTAGKVPQLVEVNVIDPAAPIELRFEYVGAETTSRFGEATPAGRKVNFEYVGNPPAPKVK